MTFGHPHDATSTAARPRRSTRRRSHPQPGRGMPHLGVGALSNTPVQDPEKSAYSPFGTYLLSHCCAGGELMRTWRSVAALASAVALTTCSSIALNAPSAGAAAPSCSARQAENLFGSGSLVPVGVPTASASGKAAAGAVDLHTASGAAAGRFSEASFAGLPAPAANDRFGAAVSFALREVNACPAIVVGAPGADGGRGTVTVASGTSGGLDTAHAVRLVGPSVASGFGVAVAADGPDIWVGAPYVSVDGVPGAGAVYHYKIQTTTASHCSRPSPRTPRRYLAAPRPTTISAGFCRRPARPSRSAYRCVT